MSSAREICLKLLDSAEKSEAYSSIALSAVLKENPDLKPVDRRFISALYYGVIERKLTLDHIISTLSKRSPDKTVRQILRMGLYQILYMDSVPDNAAVNESVKLSSRLKNRSASGYINALLRNFIRGGKKIPLTGDYIRDLSVTYSAPEWICSLWIRDYGENAARSLLERSLGKAPMTARFNLAKFSEDEIISELSNDGVGAVSRHIPGCYDLTNCGSLEELSAFKKGMFHIQDLSCQICAQEVDPKPDEVVLDLCSAPGGKAFTMAELAYDKAKILAYDLHENRVRLIKSGAERLGLSSISAYTGNAKVFDENIPPADRILCDVPCSGLGVIRRKPDIKYRADPYPKALCGTQTSILKNAVRYLKPGGIMVYSTCTLRKAENDDVVSEFLNSEPEMIPEKLKYFNDFKITLLPGKYPGDGFFIAKFRKRQ